VTDEHLTQKKEVLAFFFFFTMQCNGKKELFAITLITMHLILIYLFSVSQMKITGQITVVVTGIIL